ncbi:MAG TPA: DnaA/Hda family protein [Rickettsiales bacterium]|nr:DnaA/Hda family protein [Rickettsiales bacterium]
MQLNLPFSVNIDIYDEKNFIVHDGNKEAFNFIKSINFLNNNVYLLSGAEKSGKTYLCHIWQKEVKATFIDNKIFNLNKEEFISEVAKIVSLNGKYILEDLYDVDENKLLYLLNMIIEKRCILLITSKKTIHEFKFKVNDLQSRFCNIINVKLQELNEDSKQKIILKLLSDKQMTLDFEVLEFISKKISGNYDIIFGFVNGLETLIEKGEIKKITINNIKNLL